MPKDSQRRRSRRSGFVIVTVLILVSSILALTGGGINRSVGEQRTSTQFVNDQQAVYAAEAGLTHAVHTVRDQITITGQFPAASTNGLIAVAPPTLSNGTTFQVFQVTYDLDGDNVPDPAQTTVVPSGPFQGMRALSRRVKITARADVGNTQAQLVEFVSLNVIPTFQFAIFDHDDFTLTPGPPMNISGPIFANGTISMRPGNSGGLMIDGMVSATGGILAHTSAGYSSANIQIKDGNGVYQSMRNGNGTWLESTSPNWAADSAARWSGRVQNGVAPVKYPIPSGVDPIEMIKRGLPSDTAAQLGAKLYYRADLRIMDGDATDQYGAPVSLPAGTITTTTFYDRREGQNVCATQIDVDKLKSSGLVDGKVVYVGSTISSGSGCFSGVRLVNGSALPTGGMTLVSHHPLYVKGNFNVTNKQPAALIGDALTLLSTAWNDANSTLPLSSRLGANTTLNAAIMVGRAWNSESSQHAVRLLENWNGTQFTFTGSDVSAWDSDEVSHFLGGFDSDGIYEGPFRNWSFDASFLTDALPPGTPVTYTATGLGWYQE